MATRGEKRGGTTAAERTGSTQGSGTGTAVQERPEQTGLRRRGFGPAAMGGTGLMRPGIPPSPWELMGRMSEELSQLFDSIGGAGTAPVRGRAAGAEGVTTTPAILVPQIDVIQRPDAVVVRADLPGMNADDIEVSIEDGRLVISGERREERREEGEGFVRSEISYGTFYRTIPLPDGADENNIAAVFRNGVLEVVVPVSERDTGRRVKVQADESAKGQTQEGRRSQSEEGRRTQTNA
jgi:HSP20 family protein